MAILIDTRPLGLALKAPYYGSQHPVRDLALKAQALLREQIERNVLAFSPKLVGELCHVLTERGLKLPKTLAYRHIEEMLQAANILYRSPDAETVREAVRLSTQTCVHIWDFLMVLPFRGVLEKIYTTAPHFLSCPELQISPVENPFGIWVPEGKNEP